MALILEVRHADGTLTRHSLGEHPLTIGRALTNDIVLDDAYADARHAVIAASGAGSGEATVTDEGSVNGVVMRGSRTNGRATLRPGDELRIGRTTLRVRDTDEALAPALPLDGAATPPVIDRTQAAAASAPARAQTTWPPASRGQRFTRWLSSGVGQLALVGLAAVTFGALGWATSSGRSSASDVTSMVLGLLTLCSLWAALWAVTGRIAVHRARFLAHLATVAVAIVIAIVVAFVADWGAFLFPDLGVGAVLIALFWFGAFAVLIERHLSLASAMPRRRRRVVVGSLTGALVAIVVIMALVKDDDFSTVPRFSAELEPAAPGMIPTRSPAVLESVAADLTKSVDQLAKKKTK